MSLRPYQQAASDSAWQHFINAPDVNGCVVIPTAGGKTHVIGDIARRVAERDGRVLLLADRKELIGQGREKLATYCGQKKVGVYAAGLKSRDMDSQVIAAQIQSCYNKAFDFGKVDCVLIDEAHGIKTGKNGEGRYRTFLDDIKTANPDCRVLGLTATPYRMNGGMICDKDNFLHEVIYEIGVKDLIDGGYISPLVTKSSKRSINTSGLHYRAGEYVKSEVENLWSDIGVVKEAVSEIIERSEERHAVLIFCCSIAHMRMVEEVLKGKGQSVATVCGEDNLFGRDQSLDSFKSGKVKYMCNVDILTTGFDYPALDTVAMLRPTMSPGLYYQMIGRGFRLSPETGKRECLVLDYAENILNHGPVDLLSDRIKAKDKSGVIPQAARHRVCPECDTNNPLNAQECSECGYKWPLPEGKPNHGTTASDLSPVSDGGGFELKVYEVEKAEYLPHLSRKGDTILRVNYYEPLAPFQPVYSEYVCLEHKGYARKKAEQWWYDRSEGDEAPEDVEQAMRLVELLRVPERIKVKVYEERGKFDELQRVYFEEDTRPVPVIDLDDVPF